YDGTLTMDLHRASAIETSLVTTTEVLAQENPEDGGVEQGAYQSCGPHLVRGLQQFHKQVLARRPSCALSTTLTSPAVRVGERARYVKQGAGKSAARFDS